MLVCELVNCGRENDLAIFDQGRRITYGELANSVEICRDKLYSMGVRCGDRVAIFSRNSAEFIYSYLGITALGAIAVPINFQLSLREIEFILRDAEIQHILTYVPLKLHEELVEQHEIQKCATLDSKIPHAPEIPSEFTEDDPAVLIYTSGTTGNPKGAILSHKNLVRNVEQIRVLKCNPDHRILCVLPMYHCFGWTCCVLNALFNGASIFVLDSFTPKETIETIREHKITDLFAVPSICRLITKLAKKSDLDSLQYIMSSGTTLPLQVAKEFEEKFDKKLSEGYGLSEASPIVTLTPPGMEREGSIGLAIPDEELRIVNPDGSDVKPGEPGELWIKGDNIMLGYWNLPNETRKVLEGGYLHTGDVARIDSDGYVFIVNRLKDMIISMGENIYPREIEELIYKFPGIREAAVIGVEDSLRGQAGACFYSVEEDSNVDIRELKKYLQHNLALYKIPREFHKVDKLPRTSTGKISKREILNLFNEKKSRKGV